MTNRPAGGLAIDKAPCILAVEDDPETSRLLSEYLGDFGLKVDLAASGAQMKMALDDGSFDLVLLDLGLPDDCGLALCSWSKAQYPRLPVILLTAQDDAESCIEGLGRGADDYVGKPFRPRELLARMRAVLRWRFEPAQPADGRDIGSLQLDPALHRLTTQDGSSIPLSPQESRLLAALVEQRGRVLSRDLLLDALHAPGADVSDRAVDTLVSSLRRKLGDNGTMIQTVRGEGYLLARNG